jgi:hypothetical protein
MPEMPTRHSEREIRLGPNEAEVVVGSAVSHGLPNLVALDPNLLKLIELRSWKEKSKLVAVHTRFAADKDFGMFFSKLDKVTKVKPR